MLSSVNKAPLKFLIILLVTNQSETNFNPGRKSSTALSQVSWVLFQANILA